MKVVSLRVGNRPAGW